MIMSRLLWISHSLHALKEGLNLLTLRPERALLQYVDNLMICAPTQEQSETDAVVSEPFKESYKSSLSGLQFVKQHVTFLSHVIAVEGKFLSPKSVNLFRTLQWDEPKNT